MEQELNDEIRDKLTKVCICKSITKKTIKEVQNATGAGSGACGGRRCTAKIQELLKEAKQ